MLLSWNNIQNQKIVFVFVAQTFLKTERKRKIFIINTFLSPPLQK